MHRLFIIYSFVIISLNYAQTVNQTGRPFVTNFTPKDYSAGAQNWAALQDEKGILYFANQRGVLQFDGIEWNLIPVLDDRTVLTLALDDSNKIWCGTQNDFGYLSVKTNGEYHYVSSTDLIPDSVKPIGKVRWIHSAGDTMFLLSSKLLVRKVKDDIKIWQAETVFYRQHIINNVLHIYESRKGLEVIKDDSLILASDPTLNPNDTPTSIFNYGEKQLFISTWRNGLFKDNKGQVEKFVTEIDDELKSNPVIDAKFILPDMFILAGFNGGSYLIDTTGNLIRKFDKKSGLINELCNRIFVDQSKSIWLCNNYGITRIEPFSPFTFYGEEEGLIGNLVDIVRFKNNLFVATDNKLYKLSRDETKFTTVPNTELCWDLLPLTEEMLAATNYGVYAIKNNSSDLLILNQKKAFTLHQSKYDSNKVYVGTDEGVEIIEKVNGSWRHQDKIEGINEEIRDIEETAGGDLWICTFGSGIINYKKETEKIKTYGLEDGLQDLKFYKAAVINGDLYFYSAVSAVLKYDKQAEKFYTDNDIFNERDHISRLMVDDEDNIWMQKLTEKKRKIMHGVLNKNGNYEFHDTIFSRISYYNTKTIYPDKNGVTWIGHQFGLIKYHNNGYGIPKPFNALISHVRYKDSTVYSLNGNSSITLKFPYENNNIRFEFSLPSFESREAIAFQYYLDGYEDKWSQWSKENQKDYTNLYEGDYCFYVRGKDIYNQVSEKAQFNFKVLPPWYRSSAAYISYLFLFGLAIFAVDRIRTAQINKKNKIELKRRLKHQYDIDKAKSEERKKVRKKTAADFHDDLGHLLTKISLFTEMARKNSLENVTVQKYLNGIINSTSQLSTGMKDLIWTLDSDKDTLYDALIRIKDFGESLFENTTITFFAEGIPDKLMSYKLNMEQRKHLVLIFKEIMNNCCKYSQAQNAVLNIIDEQKSIIISFIDDGIGFDPNEKSNGNGLNNIKMRAEIMQWQINISGANRKTKISLVLNS